MSRQVLIENNDNKVIAPATEVNKVVVLDNCEPNSVKVYDNANNVIKVITQGPQGPVGIPSDISGYLTTASFNAITSSMSVLYAESSSHSDYAHTSSFATNAQIASYANFSGFAISSSFALNARSSSYAITSSFAQSGNGSFSGSFSGSGQNLSNIPASGIVGLNLSQISSGSYSASISENGLLVNSRIVAESFTGSLEGTSSWASNAITASYAMNVPETASYAIVAATASSADNFLVRGTLTAQTIVAQVITSSTDYVTGSTRFGSLSSDTHQFTGSVSVSGSLISSNITGSLFGTSSWAQNSLTASYVAASSVVGLNLSQIATGSISASVNTDSGSFSIISGSASLLFISNSGNVGIGTAIPIYKLDVSGTVRFQNSLDIVGTITSTASGFALYHVNSSVRMGSILYGTSGVSTTQGGSAGSITLSSANYNIGLNKYVTIAGNLVLNTSLTASGSIARSLYLNNTLVASASGDTLVALDIAPVFSTGSFTGLNNLALRVVSGSTLLVGSGNTSASNALVVQNSDSSNILIVGNDSSINIYSASAFKAAEFSNNSLTLYRSGSSLGVRLLQSPSDVGGVLFIRTHTGTSANTRIDVAVASANNIIHNFNNSNHTLTINNATTEITNGNSLPRNRINIIGPSSGFVSSSGTSRFIAAGETWAVNSGSTNYIHLELSSSINQTGGANGITRGLYVNPTLISASDWRSIEWSNNASAVGSGSWGLYGSGSAPNYISGSLSIGTLSTGSALTVRGIVSASGFTGSLFGTSSWAQNSVTASFASSTTPITRTNFSITSSTLANEDSENLQFSAYTSYILMKVSVSSGSWVRIYTDSGSRTNDSSRTITTIPSAGSGLIAEVALTGSGTQIMTPFVVGGNLETPTTNTVYLRVTNKSGIATPITVTMTMLQLEP